MPPENDKSDPAAGWNGATREFRHRHSIRPAYLLKSVGLHGSTRAVDPSTGSGARPDGGIDFGLADARRLLAAQPFCRWWNLSVTGMGEGTATDISGTARLLRAGRRMAFGTAEITDGDGTLVAHSTLTYIRPTG